MSLDRTQEPTPGAIREFSFPPTAGAVLPNGVRVRVATQRALPVVTVRVILDAGAALEGTGEEGLATLVANALEGGTERLDGEALAWELESAGLQLESWAGWDSLQLECTAVRDQLPAALALLAEVVRRPAFPAAEVERMRDEQLAELLQRQVEPRALADDMASHFLFATDSPYARPLLGRRASVERFDDAAVRAFHARRFGPDRCAVVLAGAIEPAEAEALVAASFGDWSGAAIAGGAIEVAPRSRARTLHLVDRAGAVQTELRIGHVGVARSHPDYFALLVMNGLLGGTFTSRLNLSLREKHGFTYGVRSGFGYRRAPGPFVIQTAVGTDVTVRAIEETLREVGTLLDEGATEEEVSSVRHYLAGVFPLEIQTTEQLAGKLAEAVIYDLPDDYFASYRDRITAVTRDDVNRAARTHIRPAELAIVVVGDAATLAADLESAAVAPVVRHEAAAISA